MCGRFVIRGQFLWNFVGAGKCGSPAKNKNRTCFYFRSRSTRTRTRDVTSCYDSVTWRSQLRATGRTKMVILEVRAEPADNLEFAAGIRHAVRYCPPCRLPVVHCPFRRIIWHRNAQLSHNMVTSHCHILSIRGNGTPLILSESKRPGTHWPRPKD